MQPFYVTWRTGIRVAGGCNPCGRHRCGCVLPHMTSTIETTTAETTRSPQERVDAWLVDFESALAVRDIERAVSMFAVDSFWRDLVAFTWNLKTMEGRDSIAAMLTERLAPTDPARLRTREAPSDDGDGV